MRPNGASRSLACSKRWPPKTRLACPVLRRTCSCSPGHPDDDEDDDEPEEEEEPLRARRKDAAVSPPLINRGDNDDVGRTGASGVGAISSRVLDDPGRCPRADHGAGPSIWWASTRSVVACPPNRLISWCLESGGRSVSGEGQVTGHRMGRELDPQGIDGRFLAMASGSCARSLSSSTSSDSPVAGVARSIPRSSPLLLRVVWLLHESILAASRRALAITLREAR